MKYNPRSTRPGRAPRFVCKNLPLSFGPPQEYTRSPRLSGERVTRLSAVVQLLGKLPLSS
jgi:hypothetical protein